MLIGLDAGYSHTKAISGTRRVIFPSACGNVEEAGFSINSHHPDTIILEEGEGRWVIGEEAVKQSRLESRREDREWILSKEYGRLWSAALSQVTCANRVDVQVVTGLPVAYFGDRDLVRERFIGQHRIKRAGRGWQSFAVTDLVVMPQPYGSLLAACLDDHGRIADAELAESRVGIIDVGGKTTGFLSVDALAEVRRETHSIDAGCWEPLRLIGEAIDRNWPGLALRDHEIVEAVQAGQIWHYDQLHDITHIVDQAFAPLAEKVVATATQRWDGGARLRTILVTGGGALLIGRQVVDAFPHARIVEGDPVFANALGFWRYARRRWG